MTSRTDIAISLARAANPIEPDHDHSAWADAEGRAAFERIVASPVSPAPVSPPAGLPRPRRTRRRLVLGVGLAAAAGAAVAVVGLPGSPNHGSTSGAWAVTKNADGSVTVNIREYRDPAGLQAKLREAGLRANVTTVPNKCLVSGARAGDEYVAFDAGPFTFPKGYTWDRLFAGSPWYAMGGPRGLFVPADILAHPDRYFKPGDGVTLQGHLSFTLHPRELPPGDDVNIGFASGKALLVDIEKTGTPLQCRDPEIPVSPDDGSTPTS